MCDCFTEMYNHIGRLVDAFKMFLNYEYLVAVFQGWLKNKQVQRRKKKHLQRLANVNIC